MHFCQQVFEFAGIFIFFLILIFCFDTGGTLGDPFFLNSHGRGKPMAAQQKVLLMAIENRAINIGDSAMSCRAQILNSEQFCDRALKELRYLEADLHEYWKLSCVKEKPASEGVVE
jgi:hypothetical protein